MDRREASSLLSQRTGAVSDRDADIQRVTRAESVKHSVCTIELYSQAVQLSGADELVRDCEVQVSVSKFERYARRERGVEWSGVGW